MITRLAELALMEQSRLTKIIDQMDARGWCGVETSMPPMVAVSACTQRRADEIWRASWWRLRSVTKLRLSAACLRARANSCKALLSRLLGKLSGRVPDRAL